MTYYQQANCSTCPSCIPHKCPVCDGRGTVDHDFYNPNPFPWLWDWQKDCTAGSLMSRCQATCRSCWGSGMVWGCGGQRCP